MLEDIWRLIELTIRRADLSALCDEPTDCAEQVRVREACVSSQKFG
jgi:hypothetical protein